LMVRRNRPRLPMIWAVINVRVGWPAVKPTGLKEFA